MSDNGTANWIPDGYTQSVYFREYPGIHGEMRASFRPLAITQQGQVQRELQTADDNWDKRQWIAARWMSQQIVQWDVKKPDGSVVNHKDVSEMMRVRPSLFNRLWNAINNQDGGDLDPEASAFEQHKQAQREQAVAMSGASPGETLEKN